MRLLFLLFLSYTCLSAKGGILEITWPQPNEAHQKPSTPYPKVLTEGIKEVALPVYLSASYVYNEKMVVVSNSYFYVISLDLEGATLSFEGDRTFQEQVAPNNVEFQKILKGSSPVEFFISENIMMADFNRHGANYRIFVECENPQTDKRCTQEDFIRNLYATVLLVGGKR